MKKLPEGFLKKRALKMAHEVVESETGKHPTELFNEENTNTFDYETVTGVLMEKLALSDKDVDLLMGYLYENAQHTSDDYINLTTIVQPKMGKHEIFYEEVWIARDVRKLHVPAYNPLMAQFLTLEDPGYYEKSSDVEWVSHEDTETTYNGIVRE